jgi:hypothetical protein
MKNTDISVLKIIEKAHKASIVFKDKNLLMPYLYIETANGEKEGIELDENANKKLKEILNEFRLRVR